MRRSPHIRRPALPRLALGLLGVLGVASVALAQDTSSPPRILKHPRGDLWLLLPPGWSGSADDMASRLELAPSGGAVSVTVVAFPVGPSNEEILEAVKGRFGRLATDGGAAAIAWETSALAVAASPEFGTLGRAAAFVRHGHPLRLEIYLLRGTASVFAFAAVADAFGPERDRDAVRDIIAHARASEGAAAAVASESIASLGSLVELPARRYTLRVPRSFTIEPQGLELLIHAPSDKATLVAAYRETPLDPAHFLASVRSDYGANLKAQLGVEPGAIAWSEPASFATRSGQGVRAQLVVSIAREQREPVRIEQRFYVLSAPAGVLFLTGSAEEGSREIVAFDAIAATVEGTGERR